MAALILCTTVNYLDYFHFISTIKTSVWSNVFILCVWSLGDSSLIGACSLAVKLLSNAQILRIFYPQQSINGTF